MFSSFKIYAFIFISAFLLSNAAAAFSQTANAKFLAARAYDGGVGFATGDFNGDGKTDIAKAANDRITLLSGNGSGFFDASPTPVFNCAYSYTTAPKQPLSGDFNGDGKLDLAGWMEDGVCSGDGTGYRALVLSLGNGSGGFAAPIYTTVSNFFFMPNQSLAADFNGDGRTDVAVASSFSSSGDGDKAAIFLSNGSGFAEPVTHLLGGTTNFGVTAGDFNNDNRPDLIYSRYSPSGLFILPNNGDGTFGAPQTISSNASTSAIAAGDFNNDGKLDFTIAAGNGVGNPAIQIWLGNGNNTFTAGATSTVSVTDSGIGAVLPGDYNRDGSLDVALVLLGRTLVFKGGGNGTFVEDERYYVGGGKIFKGDFNNDGWTDLATTQTVNVPGSAAGLPVEFAVLINEQNGKFTAAPGFEIPYGGDEIVAADFNNDGLKDLALTGDAAQGEIALILQEPDALLNRSARQIKFETARRGVGVTPRTLAAADFNADGKIDVVVAGRASSGITENVLVAGNNGAGDLTLLSTLSLGGLVTKVITADFNGDNILDLAFSQNRETAPPATFPALSVAFGTGSGLFAAPVGYLLGAVGNSVAKGDFNGDGKADLAVARNDGKISVLLNNGSGGFSLNADYDLSAQVTEIAAADLHGDGKTDLIAANHGTLFGRVSVFGGNGNGTFAAPVNYPTISFHEQRLAVDDFNGDGKLDVAATNNGAISVLENDGSGGLTRRTLWAGTGALKDIFSADLDGDAKVDLITTSGIQNFFSISILPNITSPSVTRSTRFDFDGDGKSDVSVFRPSNGTWYLQQSSSGFTGVGFGAATDRIVPADYDGDGKTDVAVYRAGVWYLQRSTAGFTAVTFGAADDVPVPADYDGDGKADVAVFRPANGTWYLQRSQAGFTGIAFGQAGDVPVAADYDADGTTDIAVFRNGTWYIQRSQLGFTGIQFGQSGDVPVAADYDADGKADVAVFRSGTWYLQQSAAGFTGIAFGLGTDKPIPADYDGDGKADVAVFRGGTWYLQRSTAGFTGIAFGAADDKPIPGAFNQ